MALAGALRCAGDAERLRHEFRTVVATLDRELQQFVDRLPASDWSKHKAFEGTRLGATPCLPVDTGDGTKLLVFRTSPTVFYRSERSGTQIEWIEIEPCQFFQRLGTNAAQILENTLRLKSAHLPAPPPRGDTGATNPPASKLTSRTTTTAFLPSTPKRETTTALAPPANSMTTRMQKCPYCPRVCKGLAQHIRDVHPGKPQFESTPRFANINLVGSPEAEEDDDAMSKGRTILGGHFEGNRGKH
jgi:hypothetical protein